MDQLTLKLAAGDPILHAAHAQPQLVGYFRHREHVALPSSHAAIIRTLSPYSILGGTYTLFYRQGEYCRAPV